MEHNGKKYYAVETPETGLYVISVLNNTYSNFFIDKLVEWIPAMVTILIIISLIK